MKSERIPSQGEQQSAELRGGTQGVEAEVQRLLNGGKCKQAVELAKTHYKQLDTAESRHLLVQAYLAHIAEFQHKGMAEEAQTLLSLVLQRFPSERQQLEKVEVVAAATAGRLADLLRPLTSEQTSPETRSLIEAAVRRHVRDLPALAACGALPPEHPLRLGAAAIWRAFLAVTSGPVTDAEIELPELSRRSPLAAWKMLIRAIFAYYRHDDPGCLRALDAIPADAAIANIAAALRAMAEGKKPAAGVAAALFNRVVSADQGLLAAITQLESAYDSYDLSHLHGSIRHAVRACAQSRPELLDRFRQHISMGCFLRDVPFAAVVPVLGITVKNAYFWRLLARASESRGFESGAAMYWERFLRHAVDEQMFAESSMEAATVWLHIAELLSRLSPSEIGAAWAAWTTSGTIVEYYNNQPKEIAALRPKSVEQLANDLLEPGRPFQRAAAIRPELEVFQQWWNWAEKFDLPAKQMEDIALQWNRSRPRDARPLVILSALAEQRNALSLALKRLGDAEAIDPMNHQVRQARVRVTLSIAWRHFADAKSHLVEKDLADLAAMPGMNEGDRGAVLESMRGAWHALRGDHAAAAAALNSVIDRMGEIAAPVLHESIRKMAKLIDEKEPLAVLRIDDAPPIEFVLASARVLRIAHDLKLKLWQPTAWTPLVGEVLRQRPCPLNDSDLLVLGREAASQSQWEIAYAGSSAGLERSASPASIARFLLLRARTLHASWHTPRTTQCLRAALELARQAHDDELIRDVFAAIDRDPFTRRIIAGSRNGQGMAEEVLQLVLKTEQRATSFPRSPSDSDSFVVEAAEPEMRGLFGAFNDDSDWDSEDEEGDYFHDDDDDDDEEAGLFDLGASPPSAAPFEVHPPPKINPRGQPTRGGGAEPDNFLPDPTKIIESMANAMGHKVSPAELRAMADELRNAIGGGGIPGRGTGGQSKRKKRRR